MSRRLRVGVGANLTYPHAPVPLSDTLTLDPLPPMWVAAALPFLKENRRCCPDDRFCG